MFCCKITGLNLQRCKSAVVKNFEHWRGQFRAFPVTRARSVRHTRLNLATRLMAGQLTNKMNRLETIVYTSVSVSYAFGLGAELTDVRAGVCNVGIASRTCSLLRHAWRNVSVLAGVAASAHNHCLAPSLSLRISLWSFEYSIHWRR